MSIQPKPVSVHDWGRHLHSNEGFNPSRSPQTSNRLPNMTSDILQIISLKERPPEYGCTIISRLVNTLLQLNMLLWYLIFQFIFQSRPQASVIHRSLPSSIDSHFTLYTFDIIICIILIIIIASFPIIPSFCYRICRFMVNLTGWEYECCTRINDHHLLPPALREKFTARITVVPHCYPSIEDSAHTLGET